MNAIVKLFQRFRKTKIAKQKALWTTRDGRKIRLCDMEDTHLYNTMSLIRRHTHASAIEAICHMDMMLQGEHARDSIECALDDLIFEEDFEETVEEKVSIYKRMAMERQRRIDLEIWTLDEDGKPKQKGKA